MKNIKLYEEFFFKNKKINIQDLNFTPLKKDDNILIYILNYIKKNGFDVELFKKYSNNINTYKILVNREILNDKSDAVPNELDPFNEEDWGGNSDFKKMKILFVYFHDFNGGNPSVNISIGEYDHISKYSEKNYASDILKNIEPTGYDSKRSGSVKLDATKKYMKLLFNAIKNKYEENIKLKEKELQERIERNRIIQDEKVKKSIFENNNLFKTIDDLNNKFYDRIKSKLENGYDKNSSIIKKELNRLIEINGNIPEKIKELLNEN